MRFGDTVDGDTGLTVAMDPSAPDLDVILIPGVAFDAECNRVSGF